jgi:ATP-dependent RNA helicase DeaD
MRERHRIRDIERKLKRKFEQGRIPSGREICEKQLLNLIDTMKQVNVDHERIDPFLPAIMEKLASLDREELIKRFVSAEFNRFLEYYRNAPDMNVSEGEKGREQGNSKFGKPAGRQKFTRFLLNIGKKDGVHPSRLIGELNELTGISRIMIGKIEIMDNSAFLEAETRFAPQILSAFQNRMINGKVVAIEVAGEKRTGHVGNSGSKGRKASKYARPGGWRRAGKRNHYPVHIIEE